MGGGLPHSKAVAALPRSKAQTLVRAGTRILGMNPEGMVLYYLRPATKACPVGPFIWP